VDGGLPGVPGVGFGDPRAPWQPPPGPERFVRPGVNDLRRPNAPRELSEDEILSDVMRGKYDPNEMSQLFPDVKVQQLDMPKPIEFPIKEQKPPQRAELPSCVCWESAALLLMLSVLGGILHSLFEDRSW
jgi:hypothetical protein